MELLTFIYSASLPQKPQEADRAGLAENTSQPDERRQEVLLYATREASAFGRATISTGYRYGENRGTICISSSKKCHERKTSQAGRRELLVKSIGPVSPPSIVENCD
jgi:hypothetical protein